MATTSPDNLRTPNPGDPYNLVPDLQNLANDVQAALNTRGNTYRGTAAQRASFLSTASAGMLWQDTDGIRMLWKRGASAWEPAVWRWAGTTAQRNSFTQAPNGFEWYDTSTNLPYYRVGGAWVGGRVKIPLSFGFTDLSGGLYAFRGEGFVVISGGVSGTLPAGYTAVTAAGAVPAAFRPANVMRGGALVAGGAGGGIEVQANGEVRFSHSESTRSWAQGSVTWPIGS